MFNLDETLKNVMKAFNRGWEPAPAGPNVSWMATCSGGCGSNACQNQCKGSCKNSCTRSCKGNSR